MLLAKFPRQYVEEIAHSVVRKKKKNKKDVNQSAEITEEWDVIKYIALSSTRLRVSTSFLYMLFQRIQMHWYFH